MTTKALLHQLKALEGHRVDIALRDGSRIDDCELVSVAPPGASTIWIYNRADVFLDVGEIIDVWERPCPPGRLVG